MGYARHIGRVGALAVTLGVGAAIANAPGVAYADGTGTSPTGGTEKNETTNTETTTNNTSQNGAAAGAAADIKTSVSERRSQRRAVVRSVIGAIRDIADGAVAAGNAAANSAGNAAGATSRLTKQESAAGDSAERKTLNSSANAARIRARTNDLEDASEKVETAVTTFTQRIDQAVQKYTAPQPAAAPNIAAKAAPQAVSTAAVTQQLFPPRARTSVVPLFTNALGSVLQPVLYGDGTPALPTLPTLAVILGAVRDELERTLGARPPQPNYPDTRTDPLPSTTPVPAEDQHVLVIAIDGTNMSKVIEGDNTNFDKLMETSTVSTPSIVGHTTISNPSWTAILTGAWDNKTGVINNVYTPQTYDRWPTVFTQLEQYEDATGTDIWTMAIADWDVIGAIAASGEGADDVKYVSAVTGPDGEPNWKLTDEEVTDETVDVLKADEAPNFMVTYLVQVDEAGHQYGGDSQQYADAISYTDENLGRILAEVAEREKPCATSSSTACGEKWTIIVVTDHGHQPQPGFGHGFQSPRETDTFVIAKGPQFDTPGCDTTTTGCARFNPDYAIVDVTPTVLSLFGAPQDPRSDGVPLQSLNNRSSELLTLDELEDALDSQMASNDYPNIIVNIALSTRTIVAFLPYYVQGAGLPAPLGDILYVATNVPAQLVAFGTGVWGARLFPLQMPPPAIDFIPPQVNSIETFTRMDCGSLAPAACIAV